LERSHFCRPHTLSAQKRQVPAKPPFLCAVYPTITLTTISPRSRSISTIRVIGSAHPRLGELPLERGNLLAQRHVLLEHRGDRARLARLRAEHARDLGVPGPELTPIVSHTTALAWAIDGGYCEIVN